MPRALLLLVVVASACYTARFDDCVVTCGQGDACPSGHLCLDDGYCHEDPGAELCTLAPRPDAAVGGGPDAAVGGGPDAGPDVGTGAFDAGHNDGCVPATTCPATVCGSVFDGCEGYLGCPDCPFVASNDPMAGTHLVDAVSNLYVPPGAITDVFVDTGQIQARNVGGEPYDVRPPGVGVDEGIGWHLIGGVAIFSMNGLWVADGGRFLLHGNAPVIVLAQGWVTVEGTIDASAGVCPDLTEDLSCPGPGGGAGGLTSGASAKGCAPGRNSETEEGGGGGGGLGGDGGDGGDGYQRPGGAGGLVSGACPGPLLIPLAGGGGGGANPHANGGGGGGALQITSFTGISLEGGTVAAAGAGGTGAPSGTGGAGAGAGGGILLEAPTVMLDETSWLTGNGGGGGGGGYGSDGEAGHPRDSTPALGGDGVPYGGDGGAGDLPAQGGEDFVGSGGGGGGGVGIIRINSDSHTGGETTASPPATFGPLSR